MEPMLRSLSTRILLAAALAVPVAMGMPSCDRGAGSADGTTTTPVQREAPPPNQGLVSALFDAIDTFDEEAAVRLVKEGAPVDAVSDQRGVTVLHRAAQMTMPNLARVLLEYGADIDARIQGVHLQPIHWAARAGASHNPNRPEGAAEKTIDVLLEYGADINATTEHGVRPIDYAIQLGAQEWIDFLRSRGAE